MILVITLGVLLAGGLTMRFLVPAVRRYRRTAELRGDWWPKFESELQAYASVWKTARESERRR